MANTKEKAAPTTRIPLDDAVDAVLDQYREVLENDDALLIEEWNAHHEERALRVERSKKGEPVLVVEGGPA